MRTYLAQLLYDHIKLEFPQLVKEIRTKLLDTRQRIEGMGDSRNNVVDQRRYLTRIATQYQADNTDALRGAYKPGWKSKDPRKIRMHVAHENDWLATAMTTKGHKYHFKLVSDNLEPPEGEEDLEGADTSGELNEEDADSKGTPKFGIGNLDVDDDISEYDSQTDEADDDEHGEIYGWIRDKYRNSRGAELPGIVNPAVLESLFKQQAEKWRPITGSYIKSIETLVLRHNERSLKHLIPDVTVQRSISELNKRAADKTHGLAIAALDSLLEDETEGILQTTNHYFAENLRKFRQDRLLIRLKTFFNADEDGTVQPSALQWNLGNMISEVHLSNEDSAIYDIHDILRAYYKVALKRFVDNVVVQVAERHYLGPEGPLRFFSPAYIGGLSDEELNHLAGESTATTMERERLTTLESQLEQALKLGEGRH